MIAVFLQLSMDRVSLDTFERIFVRFLASKYMALFAGGLSLLDESPFTVIQSLEQLPQ